MSKFDDSSCSGKITQRSRSFMKEILTDKVVWMDEIALEVTASAKDMTFHEEVPFLTSIF